MMTVFGFSKKFYLDLLERVVFTFLQAFLAALTASTMFDLSALRSAAIAGGAAVVALATGLIRGNIGDPDSAGLVK